MRGGHLLPHPAVTERRADLTGADKAVSEVLDEVNVRMHGLMSSGTYHREFLDWLAERGYRVTPIAACCSLHGRVCEPPSELCCRFCTEGAHPEHGDGSQCSAPDLSRHSLTRLSDL